MRLPDTTHSPLQGFLCQPLLAAWISRDVHYLTHVIGATLLGAAVIWPTLHGVRVTLGTAARAATRLMFLATSSASTTRPAGLIHYHLQAVLASQGRWAVLTAMAWVQGVLLQVGPRVGSRHISCSDAYPSSSISCLLDTQPGQPPIPPPF